MLSIRLQRVTFAVKAVGPAAVASTITRMGCAVVISSCSMRLFQEVALAAIIVTLLSTFAVLVPLPAALLMTGPLQTGTMIVPLRALARFLKRSCARTRKGQTRELEKPSG